MIKIWNFYNIIIKSYNDKLDNSTWNRYFSAYYIAAQETKTFDLSSSTTFFVSWSSNAWKGLVVVQTVANGSGLSLNSIISPRGWTIVKNDEVSKINITNNSETYGGTVRITRI